MSQEDKGIEVQVPGIVGLKNLKDRHMVMACNIITAIALAFGAFFLWQHDTNAASQQETIAKQLERDNSYLLQQLAKQHQQAQLQSCMMFLTLTPDQQYRIKLANPNICQ
jgi:hypothetical protein